MYQPDIIEALKDALRSIYWYKRQLRTFFELCQVPKNIIHKQRWDDTQEYKAIIADKVVSELVNIKEKGIGPIRELIRNVIEMNDFSHLLKEENGKKLKKEAEVCVERLKQLVEKHDLKIRDENKKIDARRKAAELRIAEQSNFKALEELNKKFKSLFAVTINEQQRGRDLEVFLFDLFNLFDLCPRESFLLKGEQIDGAFELDGDRFLLEAKWEKHKIGARELRSFKELIESKLDNTLGLFLSMNGFTDEGIAAVQRSRPNLILMSGEELVEIVEGRCDLCEHLRRKLRHASQTGNIFWQGQFP